MQNKHFLAVEHAHSIQAADKNLGFFSNTHTLAWLQMITLSHAAEEKNIESRVWHRSIFMHVGKSAASESPPGGALTALTERVNRGSRRSEKPEERRCLRKAQNECKDGVVMQPRLGVVYTPALPTIPFSLFGLSSNSSLERGRTETDTITRRTHSKHGLDLTTALSLSAELKV